MFVKFAANFSAFQKLDLPIKDEPLDASNLVQQLACLSKQCSGSIQNLDCVHTMPAHFENGKKCDGSKI